MACDASLSLEKSGLVTSKEVSISPDDSDDGGVGNCAVNAGRKVATSNVLSGEGESGARV